MTTVSDIAVVFQWS